MQSSTTAPQYDLNNKHEVELLPFKTETFTFHNRIHGREITSVCTGVPNEGPVIQLPLCK